MTRFLLVLGLCALIALSWFGMYRAWKARVASQSRIDEPSPLIPAPQLAGPWSGRYLGATHAGQWLSRIDAHSLGARSLATVSVTEQGIDIVRENAPSFTIPFTQFDGVRADKGIAGRAFEDGGIVVLSFRVGGTPIDIGLRFPDTEDHLNAIRLIAQHSEVTR